MIPPRILARETAGIDVGVDLIELSAAFRAKPHAADNGISRDEIDTGHRANRNLWERRAVVDRRAIVFGIRYRGFGAEIGRPVAVELDREGIVDAGELIPVIAQRSGVGIVGPLTLTLLVVR